MSDTSSTACTRSHPRRGHDCCPRSNLVVNLIANTDAKPPSILRRFFLPRLTPRLAIRSVLLALLAFVFFGYVCVPMRIRGASMAPTYRDGSFNFCWTLRYRFRAPARHDVVAVRLAGNRVMFLKRIVALGGETVAFRDGRLYVDDKPLDEPYVQYDCDWNLSARSVPEGYVYVVGDNRAVPIEQHRFGKTAASRIRGGPLW